MENERSAFGVYSNMFKAWGDLSSSWARSINGMPLFKPVETDRWFKPFGDYFENWGNIHKGFTEVTKSFSWPYEGTKDYSRTMMQGINSYVKIYDAWTKSMDKTGRKQFELVQGLATGKEVNVAEMSDDISKSYADMSNSLMESLKGTTLEEAFKGVEEVNEALNQFADSFSEEQKQAKQIFQAFCSSYVKIMNSWTASTMDVSKTFPDMLVKGEISADAYKKMVDTYGEASKESAGALLGPLSALLPEYKDMVDDVTDWTNNYFDLLASRIEVLLNLFQGITKSSSEMSRFANETFGKGEISSTEELYSSWSEFYRKAAVNLTDNVHFSTTLSNFVNSFAEYVKSTNNLYRHTMTPPFPGKEDVDKIYARIEEMATKVEKNGEPQKKTKSKQAEA